MKGQLFVVIYSVILLGLFAVCCYLISIVNPAPLPGEPGGRRQIIDNEVYLRSSLPPYDNPDYGLEKIPEGVEPDEFRKHLETVTKYPTHEPGKLVMPPVWPDGRVIQRNVVKHNKKELQYKDKKVSPPVKGLRRSVSDNKLLESKECPGSVLLKIINDGGRKKLGIKLISRNQSKIKKLTHNEISNDSNLTVKAVETNQRTKNISNNDVIQIKAIDEIILNIFDDSDTLGGAKNSDNEQVLIMNITDSGDFNKIANKETTVNDLENDEIKLKIDLMNKELFTLKLLNGDSNATTDSSSLILSNYSSDPRILRETFESINDTRVSNEAKLQTSPSTNISY